MLHETNPYFKKLDDFWQQGYGDLFPENCKRNPSKILWCHSIIFKRVSSFAVCQIPLSLTFIDYWILFSKLQGHFITNNFGNGLFETD